MATHALPTPEIVLNDATLHISCMHAHTVAFTDTVAEYFTYTQP